VFERYYLALMIFVGLSQRVRIVFAEIADEASFGATSTNANHVEFFVRMLVTVHIVQ
jgi:hypothetical protein